MRLRAGLNDDNAVGEGLDLVLLQAQAADTPVIAAACGASRKAYIEGVTRVTLADESAEALAKTPDGMLKDPARLARIGRQAFAPERDAQLAVSRLL